MPNVDRHQPGTPNWFDLMTPDLEKARAFYGKLFGWDFHVGPAEAGHYTICTKNGQVATGIGPLPKDAPHPSVWTVYFETTNVDATCAQVKERGGRVNMEPMDVMDEGRMAICVDPT